MVVGAVEATDAQNTFNGGTSITPLVATTATEATICLQDATPGNTDYVAYITKITNALTTKTVNTITCNSFTSTDCSGTVLETTTSFVPLIATAFPVPSGSTYPIISSSNQITGATGATISF